MNKTIAWSHSVINSFDTCARRHYLTKVSKEVKDPPGPEMGEGLRVHGALQKRLEGKEPLPDNLSYCEPICDRIVRTNGKLLVEAKLTINAQFQPCGWWDKGAWCRSVIDVGLLGPRTAVVADWKTGKRKPDNDQLELFAGITFAHYPFLEEVHTSFIWLKDRKLDSQLFTRGQVGTIWNNFLPRVKRLALAYQENVWRPNPSGLCGKWCPVSQKHCEFGRP